MVNADKFKGLIYSKGYTQTQLEKSVGITNGGLSNRINGKTEFSQSEVYAIGKELKLSPHWLCDLFYPDLLQNE